MKLRYTILSLATYLSFLINVSAQTDSIKEINDIVSKIKSEKNHVTREFDAQEVYPESADGGIIKVKTTYSEPIIIKQDFVVPKGRITTIVYLNKLKPVQIINIEEQFKEKEDRSGYDYTKLAVSFKETLYILNWDSYKIKSLREGKKSLTQEQSKADYDRLVESVKKLVAK